MSDPHNIIEAAMEVMAVVLTEGYKLPAHVRDEMVQTLRDILTDGGRGVSFAEIERQFG